MLRSPSHSATKEASPFEFEKLESLRLLCSRVLLDQKASLRHFEHNGGYEHYKGKQKISVSSTGTCILLATATGTRDFGTAESRRLIRYLVSQKTSAGLPEDNAYSFAWILETVTALEKYSPLQASDRDRVEKMETALLNRLRTGSVQIASYPRSAYITQLVVRVLTRRSKLGIRYRRRVQDWAWTELPHQLALLQAKSKSADAFELAYLLMLHAAVTPKPERTPEQTGTYQAALRMLFDVQLEDGSWPLSRPLFQHPNYGIAYCYDYEMLTQLLQSTGLHDLLLEHLPKLKATAESASRSSYKLGRGVQVWSSGNFLQGKPESWATASVYHFFFELHRLLAEAVRRELFQYLDLPLPAVASDAQNKSGKFAPKFLDSLVRVRGSKRPLKHFLWKNFVEPLSAEGKISEFRKFKKGSPLSAIFFGPPGTSKTELSQQIADFLGWPLLAIDPSHLLRSGMDGIQAEANYIFRRLEETERVVVLFDEFDEFVRERGSSDAEQFSRLLTTAMLPKLASIHKRGTLVFIIATNNIRQFDLAIRRPGRFDRVVQIMPPTFDEKMEKKTWGVDENIDLGLVLKRLGITIDRETRNQLGELTFLEFDAFAAEVVKEKDPQEALRILQYHWERCILQSVDEDQKTWKQRCIEEEKFNR